MSNNIPTTTHINVQDPCSAEFYVAQIKRNLTMIHKPVVEEDLNIVIRAGHQQTTGRIVYQANALHQIKGGMTYTILFKTGFQPDVYTALQELFRICVEATHFA